MMSDMFDKLTTACFTSNDQIVCGVRQKYMDETERANKHSSARQLVFKLLYTQEIDSIQSNV